MKYYSSSNNDINLEEINKNHLFIIDHDLGIESYKSKIKDDERIEKLITEEYTIEDYLPEEFFTYYFKKTFSNKKDNIKKTEIKNSNKKVDVAAKFTEKYNDFDCSYNEDLTLPKFIKEIYNKIDTWNK